MPHCHGILHDLSHHLDGAFEVEALARSHVQLQRNGVQLLLAMYRQVCALGQVLANQSIDVFVAAALPRAVWVADEGRHTCSLGWSQRAAPSPALVVGHALRVTSGIQLSA